MMYLLDVSTLLAIGLREHIFHARVAKWVRSASDDEDATFATCAITELGFLRVATQASSYNLTVAEGRELLSQLKKTEGLRLLFLVDNQGGNELPLWVKAPKQITDGHLASLAKANRGVLATLDAKIPGAFVIPLEN